MKSIATLCALIITFAGATHAHAQAIYPIDRADIAVGARFDVKVEVPADLEGETTLTVNGEAAEKAFGKAPEVVSREEGQAHSALWLRDVTLKAPGTYEIVAATPNGKSSVTWTAYASQGRRAKNVILFIGDGMSVAHRTAARILSKGIREGKFKGELAMDDMPHMALVSTAGSDSIITDSANSMSAYTTGHKSCVSALGIYCARNASAFAHPKVETIASLAKRKGSLAVGIVTTAEITDATPAGMIAHTRRRNEMSAIAKMFYEAAPDVALGGGRAYFVPRSQGGKREDDTNYIDLFKAGGYPYVSTRSELLSLSQAGTTTRVLGLFNDENIDGALDLKYLKAGTVAKFPEQPDLVEMTTAALDVLQRGPNGFLLMVESARIDKYSHSLDWERAVYDTIMLDNAVAKAKEFAEKNPDTLIIVVPDHAHPISLVGTFDDERQGDTPRSKLGVYGAAGFPNYPAADENGYPPSPDVSRRLALLFGAYPDHCFSGKPNLGGEFQPTQRAPDGKTNIANESNCRPGTVRLFGNLPFDAPQGVHSGDDVVLTASGPGSEAFRGHIDNTFVFRAIVSALGLAPTDTAAVTGTTAP